MGTSAGNMQAQKNGRAVEELLLGKQISSHHVLDSPKLEVKTVQEKVKYKGNTSGWRWGVSFSTTTSTRSSWRMVGATSLMSSMLRALS